MNWKIYYNDGSTFSSNDGPPELAPCVGVEIIVEKNIEIGRKLIWNHDYYWFIDNEWRSGDIIGFLDYMFQPGFKIVKFGRVMNRDKFFTLFKIAMENKDFPVKSGNLPNELPSPIK